MTKTTPDLEAYAKEAGLKPQDMPPANHPLFENDADIRTLGDLVDVRSEGLTDDIDEGDFDDARSEKSGFDTVDSEDEYTTRADFEESMLSSDPDEDAGDDLSEFITGAGMNRSPNITGTVQGLTPGTATHLPLDLGADGFQIVEPEDVGDLRADALDATNYNRSDSLNDLARNDPYNDALADDEEEHDGYRIPIGKNGKVNASNDTLDGTRRLQ